MQRINTLRSFRIALPATSANLGPAFDAAALALDLTIQIEARPAPLFSIKASGTDANICETLKNNLIIETYANICGRDGRNPVPLALRIKNQIPIGKGCGSSAAARLAAIAMANHFMRLKWKTNRIIGEASRLEHHPDNAVACWLGGVAMAKMVSDAEAQSVSLSIKGKWPLLMAVPEHPLSTEEARKVLPNSYSREDAVSNIQNVMLLQAAFAQGRPNLMRLALSDRIHEPYRAALCPLLGELRSVVDGEEMLGAVLSGAGPSVLAFLHPAADGTAVQRRVAKHLSARGAKARLILTSIYSGKATTVGG